MRDGEAGRCSKAEWMCTKMFGRCANCCACPLHHLLPDTGKGPRPFGTLEASPGSFSGPELECFERSAADKPTFSHRDWK